MIVILGLYLYLPRQSQQLQDAVKMRVLWEKIALRDIAPCDGQYWTEPTPTGATTEKTLYPTWHQKPLGQKYQRFYYTRGAE